MENQFDELEKFNLTPRGKSFLSTAAYWAKILAVVNFTFIGFILFFPLSLTFLGASSGIEGMAIGALVGAASAWLIFIITLPILILMFIPNLFLYKFAVNTQNAIKNGNSQFLEEGTKNIKSYFKFIGILTLIGIIFYVLMFLIGIVSAIF